MPKKKPSQFAPLRNILPKPLQRLGLVEQVKLKRVWRAWLEVIGSHITQYARPVRLNQQTLVIRVSEQAWLQELTFHRDRFLVKLNKALGHNFIDYIQMELGDLPPMPRISIPRKSRPKWMDAEMPKEWEQEIEDRLSHIPEGDIKNTARRIMANQLKLNRLAKSK